MIRFHSIYVSLLSECELIVNINKFNVEKKIQFIEKFGLKKGRKGNN